MALELDSLIKSINSLDGVLIRAHDSKLMASLDEVTRYCVKAGVIQNFEFTYEVCWKFMKRWLEENVGASYVDGVSRQELFRIAAENRLITDVERWLDYHKARNLTSHTYNAETAESVFESATEFIHDAKRFLKELEARND